MSLRPSLPLALAAGTLLATAFVAAELVIAGRVGAPIDDGWIYLAFARSLAAGEGFTYPGHDGPVPAVTGPIWMAVLAAAIRVFGAPIVTAKVVGIVTAAAAIAGSHRLALAATGQRATAAVFALLVAVSPRLVWGATSWMEVPFYVAAVTWGLALHLEARGRDLPRWAPALVVLTAAGWARPECFVFPVLCALDRRRVAAAALCLAALAPYPLFHLAIYGHPLPTTFYAKAAGDAPWTLMAEHGAGAAAAAVGRGVLYEAGAFLSWLPTFLPVVVPGLVIGVIDGRRRKNGVPFVLLALIAFVVARGALGFSLPWFQYGRYYAHAWPLFLLPCLAGFDLRRVALAPAAAALAIAAAFFVLDPLLTTLYAFEWNYGVDVRVDRMFEIVWLPAGATLALAAGAAVATRGALLGRPPAWLLALWLVPAIGFVGYRHGRNVDDTYRLNVAMAHEIRATVPEGEVVACYDIGALGYFADRPLLDLAGLGSPDVVFRPRGEHVFAVLRRHRPRWLCVTAAQTDMINPGKGRPDGVEAFVPRTTISHPANITVAGENYHLIEVRWQ